MDLINPGPTSGSVTNVNSNSGPASNPSSGSLVSSGSESISGSKNEIGSDANFNFNPGPESSNKKPNNLRNLKPRAAAAMDFNDNLDSDEEFGGLLSADYKAQRKTTQDLMDFLRTDPPEAPVSNPLKQQQQKSSTTIGDEDKKKRSFFKFRSKKSNPSLGNGGGTNINGATNLGGGNKRSSLLLNGTSSNISSVSGVTMGKGKSGEDVTTATLPNGKKYIMIAVDYKDSETGAVSSRSGGSIPPVTNNLSIAASNSRRQSKINEDFDASPLLLGVASKRTSMISSFLDDSSGAGDARRRSAILNPGMSETSRFMLDSEPFLLDGLSLDTNSFLSQSNGQGVSSEDLQRSVSTKSKSDNTVSDMSRSGSKRTSKVTFNTPRINSSPLDEAVVSEALTQRIAQHKAKQQEKNDSSDSKVSSSASISTMTFPEIVLPKPVSRKKVRHVQIQTQHSIMRPMYTQTEPYDSLVQDLEVKDWSTQTCTESVACSTEDGTLINSSTDMNSATHSSTSTSSKKDGNSGAAVASGRPNSKVASLVASLTQPAAATTVTTTTFATSRSAVSSPTTTTSSTSPFSTSSTSTSTATPICATEANVSSNSTQDELTILRQQNATLQNQVTTLQRDLAAEMRARQRVTAAMQDTRVKFEVLSRMATDKIKEMIFHRQILDKEMQELRTQVDMQSDTSVIQQGEMLFRQEQMQMQQKQQ